MGILEATGFKELIAICEKKASLQENLKLKKKILKESGKLVQKDSKSLSPRSIDNSKSGRKGSRPNKHMADAIPLSTVKNNKNGLYVVVGWEKEDTSPYFYAKFIEWGTSKIPPKPFLEPALENNKSKFNSIAKREYEKFVQELNK